MTASGTSWIFKYVNEWLASLRLTRGDWAFLPVGVTGIFQSERVARLVFAFYFGKGHSSLTIRKSYYRR